MKDSWAEPDVRDEVIDYVRHWSDKTGIKVVKMVNWIGIDRSKYYQWRARYGKVNEHNALIPRDFWLNDWEKQSIIAYYLDHPLEGYRRLTYMMMDDDLVAVSPSSVYRVLKNADLLNRWNPKPSKKGDGFTQPLKPHEHWHIDICYINISGTFYYLCSILKTPLSLEDARRMVTGFVAHYNEDRLHSSIGYVTPKDALQGRAETIHAQRDAKLAAAREARKTKRDAS